MTLYARPEPGADRFTARLSESERDARCPRSASSAGSRGRRVFHEGDHSNFVVVIVEGRIKIVTTSIDGGESLLSVRGAGSLVGELAALDDAPRLATAVVLEPLTAHVLTADEFRGFLARHPATALELARTLIERLRESDRRRAEFGSFDVTRRLAALLLELDARATADGAGLKLSQQELAGMIGASRESVARALTSFRDRGLVETGRRTIRVVDRDGLRSLA